MRDLLLTGRSINAAKALAVGLASQVAGEGEALRVARSTAAQILKFDRAASAAAKRFAKPIPLEELRHEIDLFCELFARPAVMEGLRKFVEEHGRPSVSAVSRPRQSLPPCDRIESAHENS